jgi:hypothetical protein
MTMGALAGRSRVIFSSCADMSELSSSPPDESSLTSESEYASLLSVSLDAAALALEAE